MGEVSLKAPETPRYLRLATQVLEARRQELENGHAPEPEPQPPAPSSPAVATLEPPSAAEVVETADAPEPAASASDAADSAEAASVEETPSEEPELSAAPVAEETPVVEEAVAAEPVAQDEIVPALPAPEAAPAPVAEAAPAPARRARWFRGQLPVVYFEDGSSRIMESLDALKDLLRSRGLTPHPRGDASMLLWQVRNRLGLSVDQVDA